MKATIISTTFVGLLAVGAGVFVHFVVAQGGGGAPLTASVYDTVPQEDTPIINWVKQSEPATAALLHDAYQAFFSNYTTPLPEQPYVTAVACTASILDQGLRTLSADEQMNFARAYNTLYNARAIPAELFVFDAPAGTITPAIAALVQEYMAVRLREETTPELQSQVLERLVTAAGGQTEVKSFSRADCAPLPVAKKYQ